MRHRLAEQFARHAGRRCSRSLRVLELGVAQSRAQPPQAHSIQPPEGRQQGGRELLVGPLVRRRHAERDELHEVAHHALAAERPGERGGARRHLAGGELDLEIGDLAGVVGDDRDSSPRQAVQDVPLAHDARDAVDLFEARRRRRGTPPSRRRRAAARAGDDARRCRTRRSPRSRVRARRVRDGVERCGASRTHVSPSSSPSSRKRPALAPRKAPEPMSGSPSAMTATPRARSARTSITPPGVSSCASSMSTARSRAAAPADARPLLRAEPRARSSAASCTSSAGSRCAARIVPSTSRYSREERCRGHPRRPLVRRAGARRARPARSTARCTPPREREARRGTGATRAEPVRATRASGHGPTPHPRHPPRGARR